MSSSSVWSAYAVPSVSVFVVPLLSTMNVRFLLWLFSAAPSRLVMLTPLSTMACFFSL